MCGWLRYCDGPGWTPAPAAPMTQLILTAFGSLWLKKLFDADIFEEKATQDLEMIHSTILDIEQGLAGQICV